MKKFVFTVCVGLAIVACNSNKLAIPSQADVDRVAETYPDYTLASLKEGQTLYLTNCGSCHGLKDPTAKTEEQWKKIVPEMAGMINKHEVKLDAKSEDLILKYVTAMCSKPTNK